MTWIISMVIAVVVSAILWGIGFSMRRSGSRMLARSDEALMIPSGEFEQEWVRGGKSKTDPNDLIRWGRILEFAAVGLVVLWIGFQTLVSTIVQVPAGHIGIVFTFKDITGQVPAGLHAIYPWQSVENADTRVQRVRFGTENAPDSGEEGGEEAESANTLVAFSSETQDVFIQATLNFRIDERDIQTLFSSVGPDYFNKLIRPRVLQIFKDTTVKFPAVEIAPSREAIREEVRRRLREELAPASIEVVDLLIDDIDFQPAFKAAIEQKQVATQDAQREEERIRQRAAEAEQVRQTAKGTADALEIEAEGQAKANRALSESITDQLIQFQAVQKLAPNIQIALIPSGEGVIIDPTSLVGQLSPSPSSSAPSPAPQALQPEPPPATEEGG